MYEFTGKIRYSETDSEGRLSLESLLDYFQDCSTFQSESLGVGLEYLKEKHQAWVLSSWQIVVRRYPGLCEQVVVGTFPYDLKGFLGFRNFYMKDSEGKFLAYANSLWALVDMRTGKPAMPSERILKAYVVEPRFEMEYAPRKIRIPAEGEDGVNFSRPEDLLVRPYHLDTNHHVNNGQFIRMAMSFLPEGFTVTQLRAEYKKQAFLNDVLKPCVAESDGIFVVSLRDGEDKPYVNVEFTVEKESVSADADI